MTVAFVFRGSITPKTAAEDIFADGGGHNISVSSDTKDISRNDITVFNRDGQIIVQINGLDKNNLSDSTANSIINIVPETKVTVLQK